MRGQTPLAVKRLESGEIEESLPPAYMPMWRLGEVIIVKRFWEFDAAEGRFKCTGVIEYPDDTPGVKLCNDEL